MFYDMIRYEVMLYDMTRYEVCFMIRYDRWGDVIRYDKIWGDVIWYDMIWYEVMIR